VVFNKNAKVEIHLDEEKLAQFLAAIDKMKVELEAAATRANEVLKQLKEAGERAAKQGNEAARELSKAAEKARTARPPKTRGGSN
jgi:hypothetical protein